MNELLLNAMIIAVAMAVMVSYIILLVVEVWKDGLSTRRSCNKR